MARWLSGPVAVVVILDVNTSRRTCAYLHTYIYTYLLTVVYDAYVRANRYTSTSGRYLIPIRIDYVGICVINARNAFVKSRIYRHLANT